MIFIRGKEVSSAEEAALIVSQTENGFIVRTNGLDDVFEFDKTKLEFYPDIAYLCRDIWGKPALFWQSEIGHTRDGYSSICLRKKVNMANLQSAYAMFAVGDDGIPHVLLYGSVFVESSKTKITLIDENGAETGCDIFERLVPGIGRFMAYSRAKVQALSRFNSVDAIAAMEWQMDLMTSALKTLVAELPADKRPAWWGDFETAVLGNASFNRFGEASVIPKITEEKVKARSVQNDFYNKLTGGS